MTTEFQEHWLSAYLDDELSPDERAQVQRRLQADPAARQLLEDLQRLRGLVSKLPEWSGAFQFDPTGLQIESDPTSNSELQPLTNLSRSPDSEDIDSAPRSMGGDHGAQRWRPLLALAASGIVVLLVGSYLWRPGVQPLALQAPGSSIGAPVSGSVGESANSPLGRDAEGSSAPELAKDAATESMLAAPMSQPRSERMSEPAEMLASNPAAMEAGHTPETAQTETAQPETAQPDQAMGRSRRAAWPEWPTPPQSPLGLSAPEIAAEIAAPEIAAPEIAPSDAPGPELGLLDTALQKLPELGTLAAPGGAVDRATLAEPSATLSLAAPTPASASASEPNPGVPGQVKREAASNALNAPLNDSTANSSNSKPAGEAAFQFLWARSNAWTAQDVEAQLSQIEAFVPLPVRNQIAAQNQLAVPNPMPPRATDTPLITGTFNDTTPQQWLDQAQGVVPLVALPANLNASLSTFPNQNSQLLNSQGASPSKGSLILFVQQAEAERLLNIASEPAASNRFWQVRPLYRTPTADQDPNRKVIVILNQAR